MAQKQVDKTALELFGQPRHQPMESPQQRQLVAATLALSADPRFRRLASDILMYENRRTSVSKLIIDHSFSIKQVDEEFSSIKRSEGSIRAWQHLPDLMEQSAVDARSRSETCIKCSGTGKVEGSKDSGFALQMCQPCRGQGKIYVPGEVDRLKLAFETFGLLGKGGPMINLDLRRVDQSEGLEELSQSVAGILEGEVK